MTPNDIPAFDASPHRQASLRRQAGHLLLWYFTLSGRASRFDFWVRGVMAQGLAFAAGAALYVAGLMTIFTATGWLAAFALLMWAGAALLMVAVVWIAIVVLVRRLHDRGRPGWLAWSVTLPFGVGFAQSIELLPHGPNASAMAGLMLIALLGWIVIDLGLMPGTAGPNRYGDRPAHG